MHFLSNIHFCDPYFYVIEVEATLRAVVRYKLKALEVLVCIRSLYSVVPLPCSVCEFFPKWSNFYLFSFICVVTPFLFTVRNSRLKLFTMTSFKLSYLGFATVDKRLSNPMLPWIIAQIRRGGNSYKVNSCHAI